MSLKTKLSKIIDKPGVIKARFNKIRPEASFDILTAIELGKCRFKTIIDVGANTGYYARAYRHYFPKAQIYSFEPVPDIFEKLKKVRGINALNLGLWDKKTTSKINFTPEHPGASSLFTKTHSGKSTERTISLDRFDNLKIEIKKPALLKIDVEGAELRALQGFGSKLQQFDIVQIEVNLGPKNSWKPEPSEIIQLMEQNGFGSFVQKNLRIMNGKYTQCDLFFIKN